MTLKKKGFDFPSLFYINTIIKSKTPQKFLKYEVGPLINKPLASILSKTSIQNIIVIALSMLSTITYFFEIGESKGLSMANKMHENTIKTRIKYSNILDSIMQFNRTLNLLSIVRKNNDFPSIISFLELDLYTY